MNRVLMFIGTTIGGYVGWAIADYFGCDLMGKFLISGVGNLVGIYAAWRIMTDYFD
jgi:hypothetical protein